MKRSGTSSANKLEINHKREEVKEQIREIFERKNEKNCLFPNENQKKVAGNEN